MKLTLLAQDERAAHLACHGALTSVSVAGQGGLFQAAAGPGCFGRAATLDLSGVEYIDSAGVSWLIVAHREFRQQGGRLVLHSLAPAVRRVFEVMQLEAIFEVADDAAAARARLAAPGGPPGT